MLLNLAGKIAFKRAVRDARPTLELDAFPRLTPEEQRQELASRLLSQIQYFGSRGDALPEWREAARITDPGDLWRGWSDLPIVTKAMLRDRFPAAELGKRFSLEGVVKSTGGSTGEPTQFFHDVAMVQVPQALNMYTARRMGWRPGMPTVIVWGSERDIGRETGTAKMRAYAWLLRQYLVDGYKLSEATVDRVIKLIRRHRPVALYGFTSMLEYISRAVLSRGIEPPPGSVHAAWCGGEMLFREQAELFEKAFGTPLLNRYGGREFSVIACQFEREGALQILRPWTFLELVDDYGKPVGAGETGRVILTSTICRGTPFLRYEIGDLAAFGPGHCLEAGVTALQELVGRRAGVIRLPNGNIINNIYWNHLFKEFKEVRQFLVTVKRNGEMWISLVGEGMTEAREAEFRGALGNVASGIPVKLLWVPEIPRTAQGKLQQVVQEHPEDR